MNAGFRQRSRVEGPRIQGLQTQRPLLRKETEETRGRFAAVGFETLLAIERPERFAAGVLDDLAHPRNPIIVFAVDQMAQDLVRAPGAVALVDAPELVGPSAAQRRKDRRRFSEAISDVGHVQ